MDLAGMRQRCIAGSALRHSYDNILAQLRSQMSDPFVAGIPECPDTMEAIHLPVLTAQLQGAILALAAPTMTAETVARTWDDQADSDYDAL